MKRILTPIISILICTLIIATIPTEAEGAIYEDTVRLHILAPSDSEEDQLLKLKIRDHLLEKYGATLGAKESREEAEALIWELLPEIEEECRKRCEELDSPQEVSAEFKVEWFDTRVYETFTLPQGYYTSLIITLGEGEGRNWWCVMYPPLCLDIATEAKDYSPAQKELISPSGYRIKFKTLELAAGLFK